MADSITQSRNISAASEPGILRAWNDLNFRRKGFILAAIPTLSLFIAIAAGLYMESQIVKSNTWLEHSLQVRLSCLRLLNLTFESESSTRGFILTNDERYLQPVKEDKKKVSTEIRALMSLVADNNEQSDRLENVQRLLIKYENNLTALVSAATSDDISREDIPTELLRSRQTMEAVKVQIAGVLAEEEKLTDELKTHSVLLHYSFLSTVGLTLVLGLAGSAGIIILFAGGIATRVRNLEKNAERLGNGMPLVHGFTWQDELGSLARSLEKAEDLLNRNNAELKLSELRLRAILDYSPALIYIKNMEGRFLLINHDWKELSGMNSAAIIGKRDFEIWPPELAATYRENDYRVIQSGKPMQFEETFQQLDGPHFYLSVKFLLRDERGVPFALCGISTDITKRKRAEKLAALDQQRLEFALNGADMGSWHWDLSTDQALLSARARKLLGIPASDVVDWETFSKVIHPEDAEPFMKSLRDAVADKKAFQTEYRVIRADNKEVRWISSKGLAYYDNNGQPERMEGILADVTDKKNYESLLASARDEATRANNAKSEFLSRMSHELRTPLNAVLGFAQLLQMENLTSVQRENAGHILNGGKMLLHLIDEVLDISHIEVGKMSLSPEPVPAAEVLRECTEFLAPMALQHGVAIRCDACDELIHVLADRQRLKQVLINLITNGIKYNRDGGNVRITLIPSEDAIARIEVQDTGLGISKELQSRLFTPFDRLGAENSEIEGTGLGLVLSKRLLEAMDSSLNVESEVGLGSRFYFDLPMAAPTAVANDNPNAANGNPAGGEATVLYIEDNVSNVRLMERIFDHHRPNLKLLSASLGKKGLEMARRHIPNLILLDANLPDAHGHSVLNWLDQDPACAHIPVIIVSADATQGQIARLMESGANAYVLKPYDISFLLKTVDGFLQEKTATESKLH